MEDQNRKPPNEKPVSLAPLTPDQALAAALQVDPEEVKRREQAKKKASKGKSKKRKK